MRVPVRVAGGGPAGLLTALLLARHAELDVVVHERAPGPDVWGERSFTINLIERGQRALAAAGVLEEVRARGRVREQLEKHMPDGSVELMAWPGISHTRPTIAAALRDALVREGRASLAYASGIDGVREAADGRGLVCALSDGTEAACDHVVGCDGKWSRVRDSVAARAGWVPTEESAPSWGVLLHAPGLPAGLDPYRSHTFHPTAGYEGKAVAILIPLPDGSGGALGMVALFGQLLSREPDLTPPEAPGGEVRAWAGGGEEAAAQHAAWRAALRRVLDGAFPGFAPAFDASPRAYALPRASWVELRGARTYAALGGRVALVGDAAHSMTPSRGEGCNMALESAAELCAAVDAALRDARAHAAGRPVSADAVRAALRAGFSAYGAARYPVGAEVQRLSGEASRAGSA